MKRNSTIKFNAAFLVIVFSLNTIIGFACAIGINMGFNSSHHHEINEAIENTEHHHEGMIHHQDEDAKHHEEEGVVHHPDDQKKDNCCNNKVIKFNEIDKSANHSLSTVINSLYVLVYKVVMNNNDASYASNITSTRYFVRSYHPPIPDIRVQIQSFQI